jgi:5-methylcytosine-specific restriction endonuclease McrA
VIFPLKSGILRAGRKGVFGTLHAPDHSDARGIIMADTESKRCTKCGESKPLGDFTPNRRASQGVNNWCKPCYNAYSAAHYRENIEKRREQARTLRARNAEKSIEKNRRWREANPDYYIRRYEAMREEIRPRTRARYWANREDEIRKAVEWAKRNPAKVNARGARRTARKQSAPGRGVSSAEWQAVLDASLGICSYCNERKPLALDHVEPLSLGGAHDPDNLTAACKSCNCSKKDTPLLVWLARRMAA